MTRTQEPIFLQRNAATPSETGGKVHWLRVFPKKLLLLAVGLGLATLLGEAMIRMVAPGPLFPRFVTHRDLDGGPTIRQNLPNANYSHSSPEGTWAFHINSNGFRADRDFTYSKPEDVKRILVLGDSFTVGYEVSGKETYAHQLQLLLENAGYRVEVLNTGMSGLGTAEQYAFLRHEGFRYAPDLVIVGVYTNDYDDTLRSDLYRLQDDELVPAAKIYSPGTWFGDWLYATPGYRWLAQNSQLYGFINERAAILVKQYFFPRDASPGEMPSDQARRLVAKLLETIARECSDHGSNVIFLDIASRLDNESLPHDLLDLPASAHIVRSRPLYDSCCRDVGVFRVQGHGHWTPQAHHAAAASLAKLIEDKGLLRGDTSSQVANQLPGVR